MSKAAILTVLGLGALAACGDDPTGPGERIQLDVTATWEPPSGSAVVGPYWRLQAPSGRFCRGEVCFEDSGWRGEGAVPPDGVFRVTSRVGCPDDEPLRLTVVYGVSEEAPASCMSAPVACDSRPQTITTWSVVSCGF